MYKQCFIGPSKASVKDERYTIQLEPCSVLKVSQTALKLEETGNMMKTSIVKYSSWKSSILESPLLHQRWELLSVTSRNAN